MARPHGNIFKGEYRGQLKITCLSIIDINPTKKTCIYSTFLFIQEQAKIFSIVTPCITFGQPLWLKAVEITKSKSRNAVSRLRFHLLMSFLRSIGKVMECSGISKLFQVAYSSDTSVYPLSRKAYSRALRAHFVVQSALAPIILQFISPLSLIEQLSTYDVDRKYLCCSGTGNDEEFPDEISEYVDASDSKELHALVQQI